MKFNKILKLCKDVQRVILINDENNNMQYLSDGYAMYPMFGLPKMTMDNIQNLMGLSDRQRNNWAFTEKNEIEEIYIADTDLNEEIINSLPIILNTNGNHLYTYTSSVGLILINKKYIDALSCAGDVELYLRINKNNKPLIICKSGLLNYGAIMPIIPDNYMRTQFETLSTHFSMICENYPVKNY